MNLLFRSNLFKLCYFFLLSSNLFAQTFSIKGVVRDAKTSEIVPFANVFVANTTKGTSSNEKGEYTLSKIPFGTVIVSVSMVGYAPARQTIRIETEGTKEVDFTINPIEQELSEVKVSANRDKTWEKQFQRFSKSILGDSPLSKLCNIKNNYLIDFEDTKGTLKATAKQPIEIENLALGYRMFFTLTNFILANEEIQYQGYARFEELKPVSEKEASKWKQNRLMAFEGSDRHLFWALAQRKLKTEGYEAFVDAAGFNPANRTANFYGQLGKSILAYPLDSIVRKGKIATEYRIRFPKRIELHFASPYYNGQFYRDDTRMISWIESLKDLDFNDRGIIQNPKDLVISGFMSSKRLAEMLPLDYLPNENVEREIPKEKINVSLDSTTQRSIWRLQERVQLISNKAYYHPNENLWFAGRMHYADATMSDSISKVVYVEWISPQNELIARQKHHVDSLQFKGMIALPNDLALGNYRIRAYTQWMRNFGDSCFYEQIIPIISPKQYVVSAQNFPLKTYFKITTDKKAYQKREKINVKIEGIESKNFCISVTDTMAVRSCNTLVSSNSSFLPATSFKTIPEFKFLAETGLKLSGKVLDKNNKPTLANIIFYFGQNQYPLTTQTDAEGHFFVSGIQLSDTTDINYQATDLKGKLLEKVLFDVEDFPTIKPSNIKLNFIVKDLPSAVLIENNIDIPKDAIALEEVSVTTKRTEKQFVSKPLYGNPDFTVFSKEISPALSGMNPVLALQGKVPGLQVVLAADGIIRVRMRGGQNSIEGDSAPLYLIDGFPVENVNSLMNVSMDNIDRIEVLKTARAMFGSRGANGVIAIYTKSSVVKPSERNNNGLKSSTKMLSIVGYKSYKPFFSPNYSSAQAKESSKLDIRTSIFWLPNLLSNHCSFFAADNAGVYRILAKSGEETAEAFVEISN
ncbi:MULTISPECIES: carboxypeptidase-like regulatory domain-containing protein [Emticicia]|uniref:carboxypeptidase-like regulatory domain-containing protein n=1 Tax=Emticicia TaxID=312278 RepID=UPI0007D89D85|nr:MULTISPECIES: carboxypeptidase-like regulatory domain-containing protein [Emticicia]